METWNVENRFRDQTSGRTQVFSGFTSSKAVLKVQYAWNINQWAKQRKVFIELRNLSSDKEESLYVKLLTCPEVYFGSVQSVFRVSLNISQIAANLCPICWERSRKTVMTAHARAFKRARFPFKDNHMWWCGCIGSLRNQATLCVGDIISLARKWKIKFKCEEHAHCLFLH